MPQRPIPSPHKASFVTTGSKRRPGAPRLAGAKTASRLITGMFLLGYGACALAEPAARSLDQALVQTLALGDAGGCGPAFGLENFGSSRRC